MRNKAKFGEKAESIMGYVGNIIFSRKLKDKSRLNEKDFTRSRKVGREIKDLILFDRGYSSLGFIMYLIKIGKLPGAVAETGWHIGQPLQLV
jgi:hypothetical protein